MPLTTPSISSTRTGWPRLSPMISNGYTTESASSISGSVQSWGNFDMALTGAGESKSESAGLSADLSAPSLSKQKDVACTGMAMGDGGVGKVDSKIDADIDIWGKVSVPYDGKGIGRSNFSNPTITHRHSRTGNILLFAQ